jgi:hypothetical protein
MGAERRLWRRSTVVVGAWYVVIALWILIGQLNQILTDMHPPGGVSGGVTELTSPFRGQAESDALRRSWDDWDAQRKTIRAERALVLEDAGDTAAALESRPAEVNPDHIAYLYLAFDFLFAPALAGALWLVLRRRRQQFVPSADLSVPVDDTRFTDMHVIATRRILRATPTALLVYLFADWAEGGFAGFEIWRRWPHWPVQAAAGVKFGSLGAVALALVLGAVVARRRGLLPVNRSAFHTLMAVRLHVAASALLIATLSCSRGASARRCSMLCGSGTGSRAMPCSPCWPSSLRR